jgi:hypothetical protein
MEVAAGKLVSDLAQQVAGRDAERLREPIHGPKRRGLLAPLQQPHDVPMEAGTVRQLLLRQLRQPALAAQLGREARSVA